MLVARGFSVSKSYVESRCMREVRSHFGKGHGGPVGRASAVRMDLGVVGMLAELHGRSLRRLCGLLQRDFEGLTVAARWAARQGLVSKGTCKRLERVDIAFGIVRHLTVPRVEAFWQGLEAELAAAAGPADPGRSVAPEAAPAPGAVLHEVPQQQLPKDELQQELQRALPQQQQQQQRQQRRQELPQLPTEQQQELPLREPMVVAPPPPPTADQSQSARRGRCDGNACVGPWAGSFGRCWVCRPALARPGAGGSGSSSADYSDGRVHSFVGSAGRRARPNPWAARRRNARGQHVAAPRDPGT